MKSSHRPLLCLAIATILHLLSSTEQCSEGDVQLVDGRNEYEGRVEVCHDREWKTICDRMWREEEAKVVCRQLSYPEPSNATYVRRGCAGQGLEDQDTLRVVWECSGEESKLFDCNRTDTSLPCDHRRDAGVYCSGQRPHNCEEDAIRLVDGPNNASGRVEVCRFGCWGTVCDKGWDRYDANVACRQLEFDTERAIPVTGGYFGSVFSNRPVHVSQTDCRMDDDVLANCGISQFALNNCTHSQDAGVFCYGTSLCNDGEVRLFDGEKFNLRKGRVEMCFNGVWGAVCADGWDEVATNIVCTQLGYENGLPLRYSQNAITPTAFHNVICNETHSMLFQCLNLHSIGVYNCEGNSVAGVVCLNTNSLHNATSSSNETETPTSVTVADLSNTYIAILSGSLGTAVLVIIGISIVSTVIIVNIQRMKIKRSNFKRNSAITDVPMQDNEAYATLSASHHVETQPNEAYGTLVL